jgi:hypothetical protein
MAYRGFGDQLRREIATTGSVLTTRVHTTKWS